MRADVEDLPGALEGLGGRQRRGAARDLRRCRRRRRRRSLFQGEAAAAAAEELVVMLAPLPSASGASTAQAATSPSGRHCQASLVTRMRSGVMSSSSPSVLFGRGSFFFLYEERNEQKKKLLLFFFFSSPQPELSLSTTHRQRRTASAARAASALHPRPGSSRSPKLWPRGPRLSPGRRRCRGSRSPSVSSSFSSPFLTSSSSVERRPVCRSSSPSSLPPPSCRPAQQWRGTGRRGSPGLPSRRRRRY